MSHLHTEAEHDKRFLCQCGCGEMLNPVYVKGFKLIQAGVSRKDVAQHLGIAYGYLTQIMNNPSRYRKSHSGKVLHSRAAYLRCAGCGHCWYSWEPESHCKLSCRCGGKYKRITRTEREVIWITEKQRRAGTRFSRHARASWARWISERHAHNSWTKDFVYRENELDYLIRQQERDAKKDKWSTNWQPIAWDLSLARHVLDLQHDAGERSDLVSSDQNVEDEVLSSLDIEQQRRDETCAYLLRLLEVQKKARESRRNPRHYASERLGLSLAQVLVFEGWLEHMRCYRKLPKGAHLAHVLNGQRAIDVYFADAE